MRSVWKGAGGGGLVSIPVKLYSATEERNIAFHQVRRSDGSRVKYQRVAAADGEEVPYSEIAKGYELPSGETVVLEDSDFANLPLSTSKTIDVLEFVPLEQVDPIYFNKSYYLEPDKTGAKPYVLLRDALERSGKIAIIKVALRQREQLGTLRVRDGVFVLETMLWPDEVREADFPFLDEDVPVRAQELQMAESLIETLSGDFDPSRFRDDYREALEAVIEAKVEGREVVTPPSAEPAEASVSDLMSILAASVEAARKGKGGTETADSGAGSGADAGTGTGTGPESEKAAPAAKSRSGRSAATRTASVGSRSSKAASSKSASSKSGSPKSGSASSDSASGSGSSGSAAKSAPDQGAGDQTAPARSKTGKAAAGSGSPGGAAGTRRASAAKKAKPSGGSSGGSTNAGAQRARATASRSRTERDAS
ncbi:MAG: Ku protein [Frankia sp.]